MTHDIYDTLAMSYAEYAATRQAIELMTNGYCRVFLTNGSFKEYRGNFNDFLRYMHDNDFEDYKRSQDFTLYETEAMPGADAAPFPAAFGQYRALMIAPVAAIVVYQPPVVFAPAVVESTPCPLCNDPHPTRDWDTHRICVACYDRICAYEIRLSRRVDRLRSAADKARDESEATWKHARKLADVIPFGQPILVGHYSEKSDRRYRERIWNMYGRAAGHGVRAESLDRRAAAAEKNRAISSDDPAAVLKLQEKIEAAKVMQETMRKVNACIRKNAKKSLDEQIAAIVKLFNYAESTARKLLSVDFAGRRGFPDYELRNNGANIRRMEDRVKELQSRAEQVKAIEVLPEDSPVLREQHGDVTLSRDYDANRLRLHFPGKPASDVIKALKHHGFVWSPSNMAWQRQLNNAAEYAAGCILKRLNPPEQRFQVGQSVKVLDNRRMPSLVGLTGTIERVQRYDNGDVEYRVAFPDFGDWLNDNELAFQ
jgi:hypothetical protein